MYSRIALTFAALVLLAAPVHAQKKPVAADFPFWSAPKTPHASAFIPGLQAALEVTPEQWEKIAAARADTIDSDAIRSLKKKGDPNATADELAAAAEKRKDAMEKLHKAVGDILTKDQKAMIEKLNDAYERVSTDVTNDFQDKFVAAKGNAEEMEKLRKEKQVALVEAYNKKLDGILTAEQRAAVKKLGEEEAKRAAANKDKVKPKK